MLQKWRTKIDKGKFLGVMLLDLSKFLIQLIITYWLQSWRHMVVQEFPKLSEKPQTMSYCK